jgi:hypothetical protein
MSISPEYPTGFRVATRDELAYGGEPLNLREDFRSILQRGHVINGFSSGGGIRMFSILETHDTSDEAPLLGFGAGESTEVALRRVRDTYRRREAEGLVHISETQYPEAFVEGLMTGGATTSPLDAIVHGGYGLTIYQDGVEVVAQTEYGRHNMPGVEVRGADVQEAVDALTAAFKLH